MMDQRTGVVGGGTFREGRAGAAGMGWTERGDNNMNHCQCQISLGGGDHRGSCVRVCVRDSQAVNRQPLRRHYTHTYDIYVYKANIHSQAPTHPHQCTLRYVVSLPLTTRTTTYVYTTTGTTVRVHAYIILCVPGRSIVLLVYIYVLRNDGDGTV